jgi:hypothetical protein
MSIDDRLRKLESEARHWRACAMGLAVCFGLMLSCDQRFGSTEAKAQKLATPNKVGEFDTIRVRELKIVDDKGEQVAQFAGLSSGATLSLRSPGSVGSLDFYSTTDEVGAVVRNGFYAVSLDGKTVSWTKTDAERLAKTQKLFADLKAMNKKQAADFSKDEFAKMLAQYGATPLVRIGSSADLSAGMINVFNPFGKEVVSIQSTKANEGGIYINDFNGDTRNSIGTGRR